MTTPTCSEVMFADRHRERCARAVKDEGLCGIHLAAKRKRAANTVKRDQKFEAEQGRLKAARAACEKIPGSLPHYGTFSGSGYDGHIVVPASIAYEYDALKAVEAAVREAVRIFDTADVFATCDAIEHGVRDALAALDAIRKPSNGKTGEAKL